MISLIGFLISVVGRVPKALRKAGIPPNEIDQFCDQALASPESELLQIADSGSFWCPMPRRETN
jgi:hypothetical protein